MLATRKTAGEQNLTTPWLPAAWIADELYLFDTLLGLPVPAEGDRGIATLSRLRANPDWLTQLDLGQERPYRVRPEDIREQLVALVDASPFSLSQPAHLLEQRLTGDNRIVITVRPTEIAAALRDVEGIRVQLWETPFEAEVSRQIMEQRQRRDSKLRAKKEFDDALFRGVMPLGMGRKRHLSGVFQDRPGEPGAKQRYMQARDVPDQEIVQFATNVNLQEAMGLQRSPIESDAAWSARVAGMQEHLRRAKFDASYWLGLIQFAEERYEPASQWLRKRTLEEQKQSPWRDGARYNLARCYERMGRVAEARELYLEDESPQQHGNLIRARRLTAPAD